MRKLITIIVAVLIITNVFAQSPEKISYQAVIRDLNNNLLTNQSVGMQISILQYSESGTTVYIETQTAITNSNGLVTIEIGTGETSDNFAAIDWANDKYFIKTETDPNGGSNYTITGISQLLSVPYALCAKTAESIIGEIVITESDPLYTSSEAININADDITNLSNLSGTNTGDQDLSGFISSETDPLYVNSQAVNIDANDIDNLENLSGINTGDQDLSSFISSESDPVYINSDASNINSDDIINLNNLSGINTGDQDLSGKVNVVDGKQLSTNDYTDVEKNKLASITGTNTGDQDLSSYATKNMGNGNITNLAEPINEQDAVTKAYVDVLVERIRLLEEIQINAGNFKLKDIEGNEYDVVKIGDQVWMAENLKVTKERDGTPIPRVSNNVAWANLHDNDSDKAYCYNNNDNSGEANTYGALYTYAVAINVCPSGWHLPSDEEWTELENYIVNDGHVEVGTVLKSLTSWNNSGNGTDNYDFNALAGGMRIFYDDAGFSSPGIYGYWWSSTATSIGTSAVCRRLYYDSVAIATRGEQKSCGISVRCIKDL